MSDVRNFFSKKKGWSLIKDKIFDYYLTPYIYKILATRRPLTIIDCFAGQGKFDDGNEGSPLIIARHIREVLHKSSNTDIEGIFVEKKYYRHLKQNLEPYQRCRVWSGTFEDNLSNIIGLNSRRNIFLYVDPYGIKSLNFNRFRDIISKNFNTVEILLNFNSFGFLREGCRLLNYECTFADEIDLDDYEVDDANNILHMNEIANGDYWQSIIQDYYTEKISMYEAEEILVSEYSKQLKALFKYVVNIPIKTKTKNIPKYRLIFGTNNEDGLLLMSDNMNRKWKEIVESEQNGQLALFEQFVFPDASVIGCDLEKDIYSLLDQMKKPILLKNLHVELVQKHGIAFSEQLYKQKFKELSVGELKIIRDPEYSTKGRKFTGFDYNSKDYKIYVEKI